MAIKSAGRVSIRVLPDSSKFREELKLSLTRVEKSMKADIPAHLVVTRESIRKLKEQLRDLEARVKVEPFVTDEQLYDLKKRIEEADPHIRANLDAANAQRRLAMISRARTVTLFVRVSQASVAAATQTLAALSGLRIVNNTLTTFFQKLENIDKNAPKIALISSAILGLSASILALVSNFGGLIGSFAELGKISVFLPVAFSAAAISLAVLIAAFKDMKKVLKDLAPSFHQLQDTISSRFWREAANPIRHMVNTLMPQLKTSLGGVSQAWGRLFGNMAREIEANVTPEQLAFMMGNLERSIDIAGGAMKPLVSAFNTLGRFGSTYLPRLSTWLVKLSTDFDNFIQAADADGRLEKWAEAGIKAFKDFGKVLYETGRVFTALNMAAKRAGGADFEKLAGGLKNLSDTMRSEGFQKTFETVFAGAHKAMDGLFDGFARFGSGFAKFAPTLNRVFTDVGKVFGVIGENLGLIFANEGFQRGISNFFSSFLSFVNDLKPAMGPLGEIMGVLAEALGSLLGQIGPVLADIATSLAPTFRDLWETIKPLIPDLVKLTDTVFKALVKILDTFVTKVLPPLIPLIKELVPPLTDMVNAVTPVVVDLFERLGKNIREYNPDIKDAALFFSDLGKALDGLPQAFIKMNTGDQKGGISQLIQFAVDHPEVPAFFNALNTALGGLFTKMEGAANAVEAITGFIQTVKDLLDPAKGLPILIIAFEDLFGVFERWNSFWDGLGAAIQRFKDNLPPEVLAALTLLSLTFEAWKTGEQPKWDAHWGGLHTPVTAGLTLVNTELTKGLGAMTASAVGWFLGDLLGWKGHWGNILLSISVGFGLFVNKINESFPNLTAAIALGLQTMFTWWQLGWKEISNWVNTAFRQAETNVRFGIAIMLSKLRNLPGEMALAVLMEASKFAKAGSTMIGGFAQGIIDGIPTAVAAVVAAVTTIKKYLPSSPAKKGPLSGRGYTTYSGRAMVDDLAKGMRERTGALETQSRATMSAASLAFKESSFASAASVGGGVGGAGARSLVNIEGDYYGATPEQVATEFDNKLRRANLVAHLGKVGK